MEDRQLSHYGKYSYFFKISKNHDELMSYTKINETSAEIRIGNLVFYLNSDPEFGLPEHGQMISDFDSDPSKLERFQSLLVSDHQTAFTRYFQED